jgi:exopolysaccharide biosynthesis WecB/TagA/CpsF family protein
MGFIKDPEAVETCLRFIESEGPFRFCFLAVGCPQQEVIAQSLQERGTALGLALCVGASLNFLTGAEMRAPRWMQRAGLEWLHRLLQDPKRMTKRYLVRGPRFFLHLRRARIVLRAAAATLG